MNEVKDGLLYTKEHEWIKVEGDIATMGITDHAQEQLGEIAYVDLPEVGKQVTQFSLMCDIESVKAVSDVFAPLSGEVVEANGALEETPESINKNPYEVWIVKIRMKDKNELKNLLDAEAYRKILQK